MANTLKMLTSQLSNVHFTSEYGLMHRGDCINCETCYFDDDDEVMLNVLRCRLTYQGQAVTNAEAWFSIALRPQKPEASLGRTAQDGHLDSHTAPEL